MSRKLLAAGFALLVLALGASPAGAQARKVSETPVGAWTVLGWASDNGVNYCSAERNMGDVTVAFARVREGYLMVLRSPQITLTGDGAHQVQFRIDGVTFGRAQAMLLGPNLIAFLVTVDPGLMKRVAAAPVLKIKIGETVMSFELDGAEAALPELENCFKERAKSARQDSPQPAAAPATPTRQPDVPLQPTPGAPTKVPAGLEAPKSGLS